METLSVTTPTIDRQAIRVELEQTRDAFHALLAKISDDAWEYPTSNPAWNNRQLLYHIVMAVEMFPQDIKMIRRQRLITPPVWLFNWLNIYFTRWQARRQNQVSLAAAYDSAHDVVLTILDGIKKKNGACPAVIRSLAAICLAATELSR